MRSVRLDSETELRLALAAEALGVTESEFIRQSVRHEAESVLGHTLETRLGDVVATVHSKGGRARDTRTAFTKSLKKASKKRAS